MSSSLHKKIPAGMIGESWEISALAPDESKLQNGITLLDIIKESPADFLGKRLADDDFPLLYKFIDAHENLSIQVHPGDKVQKNGITLRGKTECWYIVDAAKDAKIIVGFKHDVSESEVCEAIKNDTLPDILDQIPIKKGDVLFIPAGTVHAIMKDTLLYELQESSDVTYRLYDWGRVDENGIGRELHIDESLSVLNKSANKNYLLKPTLIDENDIYSVYKRVGCKYFTLNEWNIKKTASFVLPEKDVFTVLSVLEGEVQVSSPDGFVKGSVGETIFIPANCQNDIKVESKGEAQFLYSYVS